jgi:predicted RNA-binding protein with RPS1 domain
MAVNLQENKTGEMSKTEKSELVKKATQLLLSKERKGWKDGEKKKETFQSLASKFGLSERTITNTYYKMVLPVISEESDETEDKTDKRTATLHLVKNEKNETDNTQLEKQDKKNENQDTQTELVLENKVETAEKKEETIKRVASYTPTSYPRKIELDSLGRPLKPPYKPNDIIEVKVDHIRDFGVFCYTLDEYEYKGLLHISEIKDIFVSDANDYFEAGDIIKVKVVLAQANRLQFSTRDLKVPLKTKAKEENNVADSTLPKNPPINSIGEQFGKQLQSKITTYQTNKPKTAFKEEVEEILKEDEAKIDKAEIEALFAEQLKEEEEQIKAEEKAKTQTGLATSQVSGEIIPTRVNERDIADVQTFLNNKIGALSPNAQHKLVQILEKQGMFKSTMAISKVSEDFVVDYGLIFMEMVARELEKDECL